LEEREWNVPFLISIPASPQNEKCPGRVRRHVRNWRKPTPHSKAHPAVQPTEPCLETHNAALAEYVGQAALVYAKIFPSAGWLPQRRLTRDHLTL
jgi:hypothetical protein